MDAKLPPQRGQSEALNIFSGCDSSSQYIRRTGAQNQDDSFKPLDAETGSSYWFGFSWEAMDNLTLQADFIHQELEDCVETPSVNTILRDEWSCLLGELPQPDCDLNTKFVQRGFDYVMGISFIDKTFRSPYNASFLEADSLDIRLMYQVDTSIGKFGFTGDYSHILKLEEQKVKGGEVVNLRDDLLARVRVVNVFNQGPPKDETMLWYEDPWYNYYVYSGAAIGRQVYAEAEWTFGRD